MARVQRRHGTTGSVTRVIRNLLAIYRAIPVQLERNLEARALTENKPLAEVVAVALRRGLDLPPDPPEPGRDEAPASEGRGSES